MPVTETRIERFEQNSAAPARDHADVTTQLLVVVTAKLQRAAPTDDILIGSVGDARLRVRSPIRVNFTSENDDFIAEAPELDEFGFGPSRSAALRDLQRAIVELYITLKAEQNALGTDLQGVWSRLRSKIQER